MKFRVALESLVAFFAASLGPKPYAVETRGFGVGVAWPREKSWAVLNQSLSWPDSGGTILGWPARGIASIYIAIQQTR